MLDLINIYKKDHGKTKKSLGQHFLLNNHVLKLVIEHASIAKGDNVIEIGPGCGALTQLLLEQDAHVVAVEIDEGLFSFLKRYLFFYPNLEIINKDFLEMDISATMKKVKFVGNLPYNLSTKILTHCSSFIEKIEVMIFMFQKEVADRIMAKPKTKNYSSLSVYCQYFYDMKQLIKISGSNFWPSANVYSTLIRFIPKKCYFTEKENEKNFFDFLRRCFRLKRKILKNNLRDFPSLEESLKVMGKDINARAEELTVEEFIKLFELLYNV